MKDNDGIKLMHEAFKDALLSRFGCFKVYWEEKTDVTTEEYEALTDDEMVLVLMRKNAKIARRTITKYRKELNILPASKRKRIF